MRTLCLTLLGFLAPVAAYAERPNMVVILADDMGYGDVQANGTGGKILTPNLDRLAASGMRFSDAHSSSAVCTPTRYGLLTGRYNWRSRLKSGVQGGMSPRLIEPDRLTLPAFLQKHGYHTAAIGKWHLGMDWALQAGKPAFGDNIEKGADGWNVDFSQPIKNGPNAVGFDYYFGIAASLDMVPYTFIVNDRVAATPSTDKDFPMMTGAQGKTRRGPAAADFDAVDVLPALTTRAVRYIEERASTKPDQPFFLYLPLASPHTPTIPSPEWLGRSGMNAYADFVMQTDAAVGEVMAALDKAGVAEKTLVVFTSDNGCSPQAKFEELASHGHDPSGGFRGTKADACEGGHRVPFLVRWPKNVAPGSKSSALVCLNDLMATCAEIIGQPLPATAAEDSVSFLGALRDNKEAPKRESLVHHSINGTFAIRKGNWKLILAPDSGGWSAPRPNSPAARELPEVQLYNLATDPAEKQNRQAEHPDVVKELRALLEQQVAAGRSTPGPRQPNTGEVKIVRGK